MEGESSQHIGVGLGARGVAAVDGGAKTGVQGRIFALLGRHPRVWDGVDGAVEDLEKEEDGKPENKVDEDGPVEDNESCYKC